MVWIKHPSSHQQQLLSKNGKVLLVIAHPDDEVMFFTPALLTLAASSHQMSILCLSNGNFEGLGNIRSNELMKSAAMFQIPARDVYCINDPELEDGMQNTWPAKRISDLVCKHIQSTGASLVSSA
jgi:N-acetylglucosaminylphosphatidylinositol deacetylase